MARPEAPVTSCEKDLESGEYVYLGTKWITLVAMYRGSDGDLRCPGGPPSTGSPTKDGPVRKVGLLLGIGGRGGRVIVSQRYLRAIS